MENGIEMVLDNVQQLKTVINRIRSDPKQSTNPLTMKLNGTLDAAVNGGVSKFDVSYCFAPCVYVMLSGMSIFKVYACTCKGAERVF